MYVQDDPQDVSMNDVLVQLSVVVPKKRTRRPRVSSNGPLRRSARLAAKKPPRRSEILALKRRLAEKP